MAEEAGREAAAMHATPVLSHIGIGRNFDHTFVKNFILISMIRVNVIIIYQYEPNSIV